MAANNKNLDYVSIIIGTTAPVMEQIRAQLGGRHNNVANSTNVSGIFKEVLMSKY